MGESLVDQLEVQRRAVDTETYDIIIRQLVDMLETGDLDIAPDYQRRFVWDLHRQSELVESIFLGIPVPNVFVAENRNGNLEVIDGVQRLSSICHFFGSEAGLNLIGRDSPLRLEGLTKLTEFNGMTYKELPFTVQRRFLNRSIRFTSLNDKTDFTVRYDLFQRLNTGGVSLTPQEIRNCVFRGEFREVLRDMGEDQTFRQVVIAPKDSSPAFFEDLALRFCAYAERYTQFGSSVVDFLNSYMRDYMVAGPPSEIRQEFFETMPMLARAYPDGIRRRRGGRTPLNLFEALAVGTALTIRAGVEPDEELLAALIEDQQFERYWAAGGTNSRAMVRGRIEYVVDALG